MTCSDPFQLKTAVECLASAMESLAHTPRRFAVLQFGFDSFAEVNESAGRAAGDQILKEAEQRLQRNVRETELSVRLPGDEFAVLLHSVGTVIRAGQAADRLNTILQQPYLVAGSSFQLTVSVGMSLSPEDGLDAELLLRRARRALRSAKDVGHGTVQFFEHAMELPRRRRPTPELNASETTDLLNELCPAV